MLRDTDIYRCGYCYLWCVWHTGSGQYGDVYEGVWHNTSVAVKTLKVCWQLVAVTSHGLWFIPTVL